MLQLPSPADGQAQTALGGWAFVVNARGVDPDAAARFTVQVLGSMTEESIAAGAEWNGAAKGNIPTRKSVTEAIGDTGAFDNPILQKFRDEFVPIGRGEPRYPPVIYKAVSNAIQNCMLAGADPSEQAGLAQEAIESYLETYEGGDLL